MNLVRVTGTSKPTSPDIVVNGVVINGELSGNGITSSDNKVIIARPSDAYNGGSIINIKKISGYRYIRVQGVGQSSGGVSYLRVTINGITKNFPTDSVLRNVDFDVVGAAVTTIQCSIANDNGYAYITNIYGYN